MVLPVITPYTESEPKEDIKALRDQSLMILRDIYDEVDDSSNKCISIYNKSLGRKVDVVFAFWYNTSDYEQTKNEFFRGVKFSVEGEPDFPFAHLHNVNFKGDSTLDATRKAIRLLKNLKADSDNSLELLKGFHFTTVIHSIQNALFLYPNSSELGIAKTSSDELGRLIDNSAYRKSVKSPNGTEYPLVKDEFVNELQLIKTDLDELIKDCSKEIGSSVVKRALLTY